MALYDVVAANRQATPTGTALGQAMFSNSLRMQQLKSEQALQQLQQQQLAQKMAFDLQTHNMMIDQQAEMTKAMAQVQLESQPFIPAPPGDRDMGQMIGPDGLPMGQPGMIPNPHYVPLEQSLLKNVLPVVGKFQPKEVDNFITSVISIPYKLAEARNQEALAAKNIADAGDSGPGTVQQATGNFPGAPILNVFVPPKGRGAVQLVGEATPEIVTQGGRQFIRNKDGTLKPLTATAAEIGQRQTQQKIIAKALNVDASQVNEDGTLKPEGWESVQKQSQVTEGTRSKLEQQANQGAQIFQIGQQLAGLLTPENVGVRGTINRTFDAIASQINPDYKPSGAGDALTLGTEYAQSMTKIMRTDGNIAEAERNMLGRAFRVIDWQKGLGQAKNTLATTLEQWGHLSRNNAEIRGKPVFPQWLTPDEISEQYASGAINRKQAEALRDSNGWLLIQSLRGQ